MSNDVDSQLIHPQSLSATLDALNEAFFEQRPISTTARSAAAAWIADRQGLPGSYAGMFAPTDHDYTFGAQTFTGEPIRSNAGTGHILSEEACRALFVLNFPDSDVENALKRARQGIFNRMQQSEIEGQWSGVYCCATCSVSLWRHLSVSNAPDDLRRIENGLAVLKHNRDGKGHWKRFPFYYTLLAFLDMPRELVQNEIVYAGPVIDRALRKAIKQDPDTASVHERRRMMVLQRALEIC